MTANSKFDMFDDYLKSELRTKILEHVLSNEQTVYVSEDKSVND